MHYLSDVFIGKKNNLTFIRLLAALAVIYGHSYAIVPGFGADWVSVTTGYAFAGGVAVDLFFLISGFLVTASIINGGLRRYVVSRALRIYPALWVNLIIVTFVLGASVTTLSVWDYLKNRDTWSYFLGLATTYQGAFFLPGVFAANSDHAVNGSIWSILIEVRLYVLIALGYLLGLMKSRALFNCIFFVAMVAIWSDASWVPSFMANSTNLHVCLMFYIGAFLYMNRDMVPVTPYYILFTLFLSGITLGTKNFSYAYVLLLVTFFCSVSFYSHFSWLDKLGDYSYGVYLYGWPIQQVLVMSFPGMSAATNALFSCCLALGCGMLSWHFIEKPSLKLKKLFFQKNSGKSVDAITKVHHQLHISSRETC